MRILRPKYLFCFTLATVAWGQVYEGPAILSRGNAPNSRGYGERAGRRSKIRVFADFQGIADSGLVPYQLDSKGNLVRQDSIYGMEIAGGAFGVRKGRFTSIGMDYRGTYRSYPGRSTFSGTDHFLGVEAHHQPSRRIALDGRLTAGTSNRVFSFGNLLVGNALSNSLPISEVFDSRVYYLQGSGSVTFQPSPRFSYMLGGDGFAVRRSVGQLVGVNGYSPKTGFAYRIARRIQLGGLYQFQHYDFPRAFGETNVHVANGILSYDISRRTSFEASFGAFTADSAGSRTIAADPIIQRLLGVSAVVESFSRVETKLAYSAMIASRQNKSTYTAGFTRTPMGGNGLALFGVSDTFLTNYTYAATRRFSIGGTASYSKLLSLSNNVNGDFKSFFGGMSTSYFLTRTVGLTSTAFWRNLNSPQNTVKNNTYRLAFGLTWTPGDWSLPVF